MKRILPWMLLCVAILSCTERRKEAVTRRVVQEVLQEIDKTMQEDTDLSEDTENIGLEQAQVTSDGLLLVRTGYTVCYNPQTREPDWVAWKLTEARTKGTASRKNASFHEDEEVPFPRADTYDYARSGYDRGHQCPAQDNKWSDIAMDESFLMSNICPQNSDLNRHEWERLESQCRSWAAYYGAVYIVCGPIFDDSATKYIGKHRVRVPSAFFKAVLCMAGQPRAIGFIYDNVGKEQGHSESVRTVDEIERITGLDLFYRLEDSIENKVEAEEAV